MDLRSLVIARIQSYNKNYFSKKDFQKFWKFLNKPSMNQTKHILVYANKYDYLYKYFFEYEKQIYYTFSFNSDNVNYNMNDIICASFNLNNYLIYMECMRTYKWYYIFKR